MGVNIHGESAACSALRIPALFCAISCLSSNQQSGVFTLMGGEGAGTM